MASLYILRRCWQLYILDPAALVSLKQATLVTLHFVPGGIFGMYHIATLMTFHFVLRGTFGYNILQHPTCSPIKNCRCCTVLYNPAQTLPVTRSCPVSPILTICYRLPRECMYIKIVTGKSNLVSASLGTKELF